MKTLDEQVKESLVNLSNSVKALRISVQQLNEATEKIKVINKPKPKLTVVNGGVYEDSAD
jgi:hypothetical protein